VGEKILVVGSGSREHALLWKLAQSRGTGALWCAPGNAGTATIAETVPVGVMDAAGLVAAARRLRIDLVVFGPEAPLAAGLADLLADAGIRVCGASRAASRIESSKVWAKEVMAEAGVPTARAVVVRSVEEGIAALADFEPPVVVKADGLAAGKGVVVAADRAEAKVALAEFLDAGAVGEAGRVVVLEECLTGREVSVMALIDGRNTIVLPEACDYKRAFDGDRGPNTGGMGAYSPVPVLTAEVRREIQRTILEPTVTALTERGAPLRGILYAGLMLTADGPKTLEFNARFGDPEAQAILPMLDADLAELLAAVADGTLADVAPPKATDGAAVAVVLAAGGYPGAFRSGVPIDGLDRVPEDVLVFHAGTRRDNAGQLVTAGGRVVTVVGRGADLAAARGRAYAGAEAITFADRQFRSDIALREVASEDGDV
jgi:phosphoribosylamine--glycine ligase